MRTLKTDILILGSGGAGLLAALHAQKAAPSLKITVAVKGLLGKCGSSKSKLLQAHIWVTDIRNRAPMNEVWTSWVDGKNLPARACVEAKLADPRALVEIMVIAAK